jgi:hypothetical protein
MLRPRVNATEWNDRFREFLRQSKTTSDANQLPAFAEVIYIEEAESWEDFIAWQKPLIDEYIFRGHRKAEWRLHSSIDRVFAAHEHTEITTAVEPTPSEISTSQDAGIASVLQHLDKVNRHASKQLPISFAVSAEPRMLFKFQQRAHNYLRHLPEKTDLISWLALMQHHGAPTRLLDWTTSSYVAAFFAVEQKTEMAAIWAIDRRWLSSCKQRLFSGVNCFGENVPFAQRLNGILDRGDISDRPHLVVEAEPVINDAWMTSQCGLFLIKCRPDKPFDKLLTMMLFQGPEHQLNYRPAIKKLEITGGGRLEFIRNLRHANIHHGSLFPSLEGFAKSLSVDLELDHGWAAVRRSQMYRNLI